MASRKILLLALALCGASFPIALHSTADSSSKAGDVTESRVATDAPSGTSWLLNGRAFDAKHFSPLAQINDTVEDGNAIHAYVIDGAWKLYSGEKQSVHTKRENY